MKNFLSYFGTTPWLQGLATIGGLISLGYIAWQVFSIIFDKRVLFYRGWTIQQRKLLIRDIKEFRVGLWRKRSSLSDLAIAVPRLQIALNTAISLLIGVLILDVNLIVSFSSQYPIPSIAAAISMALLVMVDTYRLIQSLQRVLWIVAAVNYPSFYRQQLLGKAQKLRRR